MAYPPAEHVPTRLLTLREVRAELTVALKAEDTILAELRKRFLSDSAFLDAPSVQFHRGRRDGFVMAIKLVDGHFSLLQRIATNEQSEAMEQ